MTGSVRFKDGAWRIRVEAPKDPVTGRRRHVYATVDAPDNKRGRALAERRKGELEHQVALGRAAPRSGMTVDELLERYILDRSPRWSPFAADETRARVAKHISPHIGGRAAERLRPADIIDLHRIWRGGGMTENTAGRTHDILRAAYRWGYRNELIHHEPVTRVERPRGKEREVKPPTPKAIAAGLSKAAEDPTLVLYLVLSLVTGARRGTVVALRGNSLDTRKRELRITRALVQGRGAVVEKDTKEGVNYVVALDAATIRLWKAHRARQAEAALAAGAPLAEAALAAGAPLADDAYVFALSPDGQKPWRPDSASHRWARLRSEVPALAGVRLHDLRHWMATALLEGDFDVVEAAGRGGWVDPTMLERRYGHFSPARDRKAADYLAGLVHGDAAES